MVCNVHRKLNYVEKQAFLPNPKYSEPTNNAVFSVDFHVVRIYVVLPEKEEKIILSKVNKTIHEKKTKIRETLLYKALFSQVTVQIKLLLLDNEKKSQAKPHKKSTFTNRSRPSVFL